ncbi:MAG: glucosamine-6-phosphate deaminase [Cyclobacteriaceae bacterium]|nr:glucosamine-6-phosphate deaminase [Cyclobacteriaceae bacterium]
MDIFIADNKKELGKYAAHLGAKLIREGLAQNEAVNIVVATGASQFEMLEELVKADLDWSRVKGFHLDEYLDLSIDHPASFRKYLKKRFVEKVPLNEFYYVNGQSNPEEECQRLGKLINEHPISVAFVGIGENAHLAFNDPPADFDTSHPFLVVDLDQACRTQQLNEGWFETLSDVPTRAISMSIKQILTSTHIICTVPDQRKAMAVAKSVEGEVTPMVPASALQTHPQVHMCLDRDSASQLSQTSLK